MSKPEDTEDPQAADRSGRFSVGDGESPVFLEGEDPAKYEQLREGVTQTLAPRDAIEELLARRRCGSPRRRGGFEVIMITC